MNLESILQQLKDNLSEINLYIETIEDNTFFATIDNKWSIAEQLDHLSLSFMATSLVFTLPKSVVSTLYGKNNRANLSYDEIIAKYQSKLNTGSKASFPYQPKISMLKNRKIVLKFWYSTQQNLIKNVASLKEEDVDVYLVPHPIIGKITWREFLYFTNYHIQHHAHSIKDLGATIKK